MLDLGTSAELLVIALAVLIFLGPKEIPTVLRFFGRIAYKVRSLTAGIRSEYTKYLHEGEFDAYQQDLNETLTNQHKDEKFDSLVDDTSIKSRHQNKGNLTHGARQSRKKTKRPKTNPDA